MMPLRCGRLDEHPVHDWRGRQQSEERVRGIGPSSPPRMLFRCTGHVLVEGGYWAGWDAEDDAAEERAIRDAREIA